MRYQPSSGHSLKLLLKEDQMILLKTLENEDSYKDLEFIISKVNFYSSQLYFLIQFQSCSVLVYTSNDLCSLKELMQYEFLSSSSSFAFSVIGVSNGSIQFGSARKIWPLLELLAKIRCGLACSCQQKFCKCSHARIFVKIPCRVA